MARILHVENEPDWIDITREALADHHHVDSASTYSEALGFIRGSATYDLALVDLNLLRWDDGQGKEILDVLRNECPSTRRIVVTGKLPAGSLRENIFDRYGVEEIIIKGEMTLPDLQRAVGTALNNSESVTPDVKLRKSEALHRYRTWRTNQGQVIDDRVRDAREYVHNAGRLHGQSGRRAQEQLDNILRERESFLDRCVSLEDALSNARTMEELMAALEQLDLAVEYFTRLGET